MSRDAAAPPRFSSAYPGADPFIDYKEFDLAPGVRVRGPRPASLEPRGYVACVGAAQTYGRYVREPFPAILEREIGFPFLNLGSGGAGPRRFLDTPAVLEAVNQSRFAIVQVLSGRSESNSRLVSDGGGRVRVDGRGPEQALGAWESLLRTTPHDEILALMAETQRNWVASFTALLAAITVPKVLFWFSVRTPAWTSSFRNARTLIGRFPQLVDEAMLSAVRGGAEGYVECITHRGLPFVITDDRGRALLRWRTKPRDIIRRRSLRRPVRNRYYPSPEMHRDAAAALAPTCRQWLEGGGS